MMSVWYSLFNKWYFGNKLPEKNKLEFEADYFAGERFVGRAWCDIKKCGDKITIKPEKIVYNLTFPTHEEMFMNVLLHEMIHVLDFVYYPKHFLDEKYDPHGDFFMSQANRINDYGWNITKECKEDFSKISKDVLYDSLKYKTLTLHDDVEFIARKTIKMFVSYLSILARCIVLGDYNMVNNVDLFDNITLPFFNKKVRVSIKPGRVDYSCFHNIFKSDTELTLRTGIGNQYLTRSDRLYAILRTMVIQVKKRDPIPYNILMEQYGYILMEEYRRIIRWNISHIVDIISDLKKQKSISEDIDEEDYDTMHHDIYDEAERLKKIADRAGNGTVKILDDKTIEFSIE